MKKTKMQLIFMLLVLLLFMLLACGEEEGSDVYVIQDGVTQYSIVYGTAPHENVRSTASDLIDVFYSKGEVAMKFAEYCKVTESPCEIIYGRTDRAISVKLADAIDAYPADSHVWGIACDGTQVAIYANSKIAFDDYAKKALMENYFKDGNFIVKDNLWYISEVTAKEYQDMLDKIAAEEAAELAAKKAEKLAAVKNANATEFKTADFGGTITADLGTSGAKPPVYPEKGEHPRVLFTKDDIPGILAAMENPENAAAMEIYNSYVASDVTGKLLIPTEQTNGLHNWDGTVLAKIQAKAFHYAVTGDQLCGYEAIYAMKNYLLTLDIQYIKSDQTRQFGMVMYIAACVYDWCYDLLTETDREQLIRGVEYQICRGAVDQPALSTNNGVKMEMGFPPTKQGAVSGHGSEAQLERDYLAFAIAIYDEVPGWYEMIGARYFNDFVAVREVYYESGMYPQGMAVYAPWRYLFDCYGAWLLKGISGESPYSKDMKQVVHSFMSNATAGAGKGGVFNSGDGARNTIHTMTGDCAIISSHLYDDPIARTIAKELESGYSKFGTGVASVTATEFLILSSSGVKTVERSSDGLDMILHNDGFLGQLITRNSWETDAAVTLMKLGKRTTANHDHQNSGSFQIYYKGMLTGDTGLYGSYGTDHWRYFHQATVAHNGLLIFDPAKWSPDGVDANNDGKIDNGAQYWYTGGQKTIGETATLASWLGENYDRAVQTGVAYGYEADGKTAKYSYIAGDITKAYTPEQADYVGRSMLSAYTGNEKFPMVFFVFDRIDAAGADFKKTFLLQVPGKEEPTVDGKTVTVTNGEGKLVLTSLIGGDNIVKLGGTDADGNPQNYLINGNQCAAAKNGSSWGRVEISPDTGNKSDLLLNVMYVTDSAQTEALTPVRVSGEGVEGASVAGVTAVFTTAKERTGADIRFTVSGEGDMTYYAAGLAEGKWSVTVNGKSVGTMDVTKESGMLTFTAAAGEVVLTMAK